MRGPWWDTLTRWAQEGRSRRRVRVIHDPISDYERYACEWGYTHNVRAGEQTRVLDLAAVTLPVELEDAPGDWWLIDGERVVVMHYRADSTFSHAVVEDDPAIVAAHRRADAAAWSAAVDFDTWWADHPEHAR